MAAPFSVCCVHLAVLGAVGDCLTSSAHEWLLQRLGAVIAQRGIAAVSLRRCSLRPWHLESLGTLVKRQGAWANGVAERGSDGIRSWLILAKVSLFVFLAGKCAGGEMRLSDARSR